MRCLYAMMMIMNGGMRGFNKEKRECGGGGGGGGGVIGTGTVIVAACHVREN